jgi:hypothetical protein
VKALLPQPDFDIYLDKEDSESLLPYLDGTKIQRAEAALRQNDNVVVVRSILRFRLYGLIDSLRLLLLSCKQERLAFLYTAITNKPCSAQWDQPRLVKGIEGVVVPKRMASVHKDGFDNAINVMRQQKPHGVASALLEAMCDQLRETPFEELVHYFIGHAAPAVYVLMNKCDKLIESLQKMLGEDSQIIVRYLEVSELLDSSRHPFAAFVKAIIDHAIRWSSSTKDLRQEVAELPSIDFDNWPGGGVRANVLAALHARSRLRGKDMLVLRPSMLKGLRKLMFESFDKLLVDLAAMEDDFVQDLKIDGCFALEDANVDSDVGGSNSSSSSGKNAFTGVCGI